MRGRVRRVSSEGTFVRGQGYEGGTVTGEGREETEEKVEENYDNRVVQGNSEGRGDEEEYVGTHRRYKSVKGKQ